jgi:hypothetical protein
MKKQLLFLLLVDFFGYNLNAQEILQGYITANKTLSASTEYTLQGFVYVDSLVTLTIPAGTKIFGDKATKGTLIITRGGKINAQGTASNPIIFTSKETVKSPGDWGGIIILGKATINDPAGSRIIEGGVDDAQGNGRYGGTNDDDNSGILSFVRIEYPGIPFSQDNEINGLTMGGVGRGTQIDHIQVSFSGDDSFEWFGGTVNCKNLIAYRGVDDDFDTDFGYRGNIQFCLGVKDPGLADLAANAASNGFESDNDATGSDNLPHTAPTFSNVTLVGPNWAPTFLAPFKRSAHIRRNSECSIYNSVLMNMPVGIFVDGAKCEANATTGKIELLNNIFAGETVAFKGSANFNTATWATNAAFKNDSIKLGTDVKLAKPYNIPLPSALPNFNSPVFGKAAFVATRISNAFFQKVTYAGAFGTDDWTCGWAKWEVVGCQTADAADVKSVLPSVELQPNVAQNSTTLNLELAKNVVLAVDILDMNGRVVASPVREKASAGSLNIELDLSNLTNGFYFVKIQADQIITTEKLIIVK